MIHKVEFLSFIIKNGMILMDPIKVKGIVEWPVPQTLYQLHSFLVLGAANTYTSIRIVSSKSCHLELGASGCTIWYTHLRVYSSSFIALSLSQLPPCTCYIIDCEPLCLYCTYSW